MKKLFTFFMFAILSFSSHQLSAQDSTIDDPYVCPPCLDGSCDTQTYKEAGACPHCKMKLIRKSSLKNVAIFIYDGVEILDFSGPGEVFAATRFEDGAFNVYTVAATKEAIISQGFVKIIPEYSIEDCPKPDIIVLPGGNTEPSVKNAKVIEWVSSNAPDLTFAISVCTGAFILNEAGLLKGKKATTWHGAIERLKKAAPDTEVLENTRWVDNGKIITTAGVSAGIDGALHAVEKLCGTETATATARYMEYDKWDAGQGVIVQKP